MKSSNTSNAARHQQPLRSQSANQSKRNFNKTATRSSDLMISKEALQHVVLPLKRTRTQQKPSKNRADPVGDHMTKILNSDPHFHYSKRKTSTTNNNNEEEEDHFTFFPLICARNWLVLKRTFHRVRKATPLTLLLWMIDVCYEKTPSRQKMTSTLLLLVCGILGGLSIGVTACHVALMWSMNELLFLSIQFATILIDWKDVEKHCPPQVTKGLSFLVSVGKWVDYHLFLRKRFSGREWNTDDFEFSNPLAAQSRHSQLWDLPPPCVEQAGHQLCLNQRYMAREEWSTSTSKHVVAINFAYLMMQEDYVRKRARRSTMFHQQKQQQQSTAATGTMLDAVCETISFSEDDVESVTDYHDCTSLKSDRRHSMPTTSTAIDNSSDVGKRTERILGLTSGNIELVRHDDEKKDNREPGSNMAVQTLSPSKKTRNSDSNHLDYTSRFMVDTETNDKSLSPSSARSDASHVADAVVADMNWVDISARIGMRVLNSTHLQRAVASQEAAERLKNITDKFVVSPRETERNPNFDFASPGDMLKMAGMKKGVSLQQVPQNLPRSPCLPKHSMWTSAAAAGATASSDDEEKSVSSFDVGRSSIAEYTPSAPPSIIRTRNFPEPGPSPRREFTQISFFQEEVEGEPTKPTSKSTITIGIVEDMGTEVIRESSTRLPGDFSYDFEQQSVSGDVYTAGEETASRSIGHFQRQPLAPGVKIAAPIFPFQPGLKRLGNTNYQMATVVSSKRIYVGSNSESQTYGTGRIYAPTNCLSVTCKIDKSFLRNGEFAELTFRVLDEWGSRYMPKHSKVPIGACVATTYGTGVVVGWRVEDDCHVIRSLWQRRGDGAAHAYLNRDAIKGVLEAAVGFDVQTRCGSGKVLGYVEAGRDFLDGRYIVTLQDDGVYKNCVVGLNREDVYACYGAQFRPVIEHIKEACDYQIMLDNYKAILRQQQFYREDGSSASDHLWKAWSENLELLWSSFLKSVDEDSEFDEGVGSVIGSVIDFLERLDRPPAPEHVSRSDDDLGLCSSSLVGERDDTSFSVGTHSALGTSMSYGNEDNENDASFWILNDMLGGVFSAPKGRCTSVAGTASLSGELDSQPKKGHSDEAQDSASSYQRAHAVIRIMMKTVALARAQAVGKPQFRLAMTVCREFLMFLRTVIKVQQKNVSPQSLRVWRSSLEEIKSTFGPIKERLDRLVMGIAERAQSQGRKAKIRVVRFADSILADELFLNALCQGEWKQCLLRLENSFIVAGIIDADSCGHYRKTAHFIYEHLIRLSANESGAAERNQEKLEKLAKLIQLMAIPKRSLLKLLRNDDVLEVLERILVRVFCREEVASRVLSIHASNFKSLRHLRILKDLSVAGRLWIPLLDAADEEFSYMVSKMPENTKEFMCPLSSIFSLCVAQFHKIIAGHSTKDWLDFLLEDDGVRIIHDIDMNLLEMVLTFSRDVKDMMVVLPYYPSLDDDILNLMDEVELDKFLKEASEAIDDADKLAEFIREKAATAIERFVAYLPKLSIPVERRDLGEGWVLSCHGKDGGDLTLSDVKVKRENLVCQVMGESLTFLPSIFGEDDADKAEGTSVTSEGEFSEASSRVEESILDHIRDLILQAKKHGAWTVGIGGVGEHPSDPYVSSVLCGLPITSVLNCAIDLWRNLELDDDELLEIAIRDVSYQIQLHKELEEKKEEEGGNEKPVEDLSLGNIPSSLSGSASLEDARNRFNPRVDPTVLLLEMKNLTLHLERFHFRIEKGEKRTIFDPVFEGCGTVSIENVCILLKVECARERIASVGSDSIAPVLILQELEVEIERVRLKVADTGADWLLNKAVKGFSENITDIVESNLKEQIEEQAQKILEQLNSYFVVNQDIFLNLLGIDLDDLDEKIVFVPTKPGTQ